MIDVLFHGGLPLEEVSLHCRSYVYLAEVGSKVKDTSNVEFLQDMILFVQLIIVPAVERE